MKRLLELNCDPVIGKDYLVPYVYYNFFSPVKVTTLFEEDASENQEVPITGLPHEDNDINGTSVLHVHLDLRFISDLKLSHFGYAKTIIDCLFLKVKGSGFAPIIGIDKNQKVLEKPFTCVRNYGDISHWYVNDIKKLAKEYKKTNVKLNLKCKICPHNGAYLNSITPNKLGVITCPNHGLSFNSKTGEVI